eukprot:29705-Amphidinium_carterae.1
MPASGQAEDQMAAAIIVTIPAHSGEVKIPVKSDSIVVRAGFEHDDKGSCEIFWGLRRFDWDPAMVIQFRPEHSHEGNEFYADVQSGHPCLAESRSPASLLLYAQAMPPGGTLPPANFTIEPLPEQPLATPEMDALTARSLGPAFHCPSLDSMPQPGLAVEASESHGLHGPGPSMSLPLRGLDDILEEEEDEGHVHDMGDWQLLGEARDQAMVTMEFVRRPRRRGLPPQTTPPTTAMTF